jgi:hypothetical protein
MTSVHPLDNRAMEGNFFVLLIPMSLKLTSIHAMYYCNLSQDLHVVEDLPIS